MNTRFIVFVSSIVVLVSSTSSRGTNGSTTNPLGNGGSASSEASFASTSIKASLSSTSSQRNSINTDSLKISSDKMSNKTNSTQNSKTAEPSTQTSSISNATNNPTIESTTPSELHNTPITNSSSQLPNGIVTMEAGKNASHVPNVTTEAPVPHTTRETRETTVPCDCLKYTTSKVLTKVTIPTSTTNTSITIDISSNHSTTTKTSNVTTELPTPPETTTKESNVTTELPTPPETTPKASNVTTELPTPPETTPKASNVTTELPTPPETTPKASNVTTELPTPPETTPKASNVTTELPTPPETTPKASNVTTELPTPSETTLKASNVTTESPTPPKSSVIKRRRAAIDTDDDALLSTKISPTEDYCIAICNTKTIPTSSTPLLSSVTTLQPTTTTARHRRINLMGVSVDVQLAVVIDGSFSQILKTTSSPKYQNLAKKFQNSLRKYYRSILNETFKNIIINGFSDGSIKCNYSIVMDAPNNQSQANKTLQVLRSGVWKTNSLVNLTINVNKTIKEQKRCLSNANLLPTGNVCANHEVLEWGDNGNPVCKYKCDLPVYKNQCGDHGECSFTYEGQFKCICRDSYSGNLCEKQATTTAKPTKPDAIALSKIDIIGIAAGIGGGLVLILLVALCCLCTRLNKAKKRDRFYGYMDNDKEFLHDENSRIENVPEYTNQGYQREEDELQMQRFEPEGKNVDYEPGQRQGAYEREDNAYRKVEEPEGGNVLIYQPKHLRGPMERQSGVSKFDEVEERSHPYRMMDTDTTYKIRRPTVNSDKNVPYN